MTAEAEGVSQAGLEPEVEVETAARRETRGCESSSASIEVLATGCGTLGALGVVVESLVCSPTSRTMSSSDEKSRMI